MIFYPEDKCDNTKRAINNINNNIVNKNDDNNNKNNNNLREYCSSFDFVFVESSFKYHSFLMLFHSYLARKSYFSKIQFVCDWPTDGETYLFIDKRERI